MGVVAGAAAAVDRQLIEHLQFFFRLLLLSFMFCQFRRINTQYATSRYFLGKIRIALGLLNFVELRPLKKRWIFELRPPKNHKISKLL